jgi:hypothetical protein
VSNIVFDLATKIVTPDQTIWSVFPGIGRKFFTLFLAENAIFLDTPSLPITPRILEDDDLLRRHVARSHAWVNYYYDGDGSPPSNRVTDYEPIKNPSFNAAVGNIRNVFLHMQVGDLVLVGGHSLYDPILIGEVTKPFNDADFVNYERYGNDRIPIRRVKWLQTDIERRLLTQPLSRLLSNRRTVVRVEKEAFGEEVFRLAYGDYVAGEEARYIYKGPRYRNIATSTVPGIDLISYFCAAFNAAEENELDAFAKLDVKDAINSYFEQDILYTFEIDFASPGEYVLFAKKGGIAFACCRPCFCYERDYISKRCTRGRNRKFRIGDSRSDSFSGVTGMH